jgi:hypothetical protein
MPRRRPPPAIDIVNANKWETLQFQPVSGIQAGIIVAMTANILDL